MTSASLDPHYLDSPALLPVIPVFLKNLLPIRDAYFGIFLVTSPFYEYVKLPDDLLPAYNQVKKLALTYVNEGSFNWDDFRSFVSNADKEKIAPEDFNSMPFKLEGDDANVSSLVDRVMQLLPPFLDKEVVDQNKLKEDLTSEFGDLDPLWDGKEPEGTRSVIEHNLTREYRALVGAPADKPGYLRVNVATVKADGHYKKETRFGGIFPPKITKDGKVSIKVMTLFVVKGFRA
ncbi:hypothetical protein AX16_002133 [Volvariella volvacea WC 439]|nr:hypothetical protein AX16_002133 [Volvariella volvacea WC 439]